MSALLLGMAPRDEVMARELERVRGGAVGPRSGCPLPAGPRKCPAV